jgi:hypothetical protein
MTCTMFRFALIAFLALAGPFGLAQVITPDAAGKPAKAQPFYIRVPGMLGFDLPNIDPPGTIKLILNPHISDLIRRDYIRVDGGFRWAVNDHFEFSPEARTYLTHGLGDSTDDGYGIGEVRLGAKYVVRKWPAAGMETSFTLAAYVPISGAPVDLTDGLNHLAPAFLVQRHLVRHPKWTIFSGAGIDLVDPSEVAGTPSENQPLDDSMNFTAGAIYDLGQIKWTLTTTYATTAGIGHDPEDFFYVQPNVLWYVPKKWMLNTKTQWILSLGARVSWGPDGTVVSATNRVRAEITFRQVMNKFRGKTPATPE